MAVTNNRSALIELRSDPFQQIVTVTKNIGLSFKVNDAMVVPVRLPGGIHYHPLLFPVSGGPGAHVADL